MTNLRGTSHCGAVELELSLPDGLASARRCDCSYCRRRGAIVVSAPLDQVVIVKGAENLTLYQWGTGTAKHWFCKTCGIYTHHQRRSSPLQYGINTGILDGVNHPADRKA